MIQWFPGHMAKARREMEEKRKLVDVVIELVDARAPAASSNPMLHEVIAQKTKIIVMMKHDLADPTGSERWLDFFKEKGQLALCVDVNDKRDIANLIQTVTKAGLAEQQKMMDKGVQERAVRALIAGVPNVGKSTLINRLVNKKIAKTGDRPGVTKQQQWIKVKNQFELLDTPGILWPKFEEPLIGIKLSVIGTIKYELVPEQDVAAYLIEYIHTNYPQALPERYGMTFGDDMWENFEQIGRKRGALESGGHVNMDKVAEIVLRDFRTGKLGQISLESPAEKT